MEMQENIRYSLAAEESTRRRRYADIRKPGRQNGSPHQRCARARNEVSSGYVCSSG